MYNDGVNTLIICFSVEQQFCQVRSFQVDMAYKRVNGDIYEIVFAAMSEAFGSGMCSLLSFSYFFLSSISNLVY